VAAPFVTKSATVTAAQSGSALAQLAISTAFVKVHDHTDSSGHVTYMYVSWFRIAETSGASGATVSTIRFSASGVGEVWSAPFRIGTAEVSDHVTNLQANNNNYPAVITQSPVDFITVTLTFVDDRGTPGTLTARLDIN
jgi:hypothetical protein